MSTTAPPTASQVVRSHSLSRRPQPPNVKSQRSAPQHPNLARRDFEQSSNAPSPHRRSESRDRAIPPPSRSDSTRRGHNRYASDASTASAMPTNGVAQDAARAATQQPVQTRRRTTITAPHTGVWQLGKTIGAGSMGKVKLAKHAESQEQVAVKIVPRQSTDNHNSPADKERADHSKEVRTAREAAMVSLLNHPYICGMRDVVRTNYHWYMLFEYVNGGQMLDYIISHGRLKEKQARKFARQIASALDYCHRNSIVHRDLKIENILISKTGDIKIIDFGLSNLFAPRNLLKTFCGSLYFAAPELLQAKQYTGPEVDIWSFGIVLYVLVCGKVPFDDQSMPQLHAKIKKGHVDYPPWLSNECRNLIHRMLQTDPTQRITLAEIMTHPWLTKGFNSPPENYLPQREPLQLPLDDEVIEKMTGFDFGTSEYIKTQLTQVLASDDYQRAVRIAARKTTVQTPEMEKKRGMFDFYKRRNSISSREQLPSASSEDLPRGTDPINAYSPLISIYYLVREKRDRERQDAELGPPAVPHGPSEKSLKMPDLPAPEAAYTNPATYEMAGEKPTGGRSRPRARTHGEDEVTEDLQKMNLRQPPHSPAVQSPPPAESSKPKESTAAGLLRRFSTRRHRNPDRDRDQPPTPSLAVSGPGETTGVARKSFSMRRTRGDTTPTHLQVSDAAQPELLSPQTPTSVSSAKGNRFNKLGRSTSVNGADLRRRLSRRGRSQEDPGNPPPTSGSDRSSINTAQAKPVAGDAASEDLSASPRRNPASRTKSLGHARRESIQARRARREQAREANVPEETDAELAETQAEAGRGRDAAVKPVYLKGLFSVSTTSSKPLSFIQSDLIRVLDQLGIQHTEIKGGFKCRHTPSIELKKNVDSPSPAAPHTGGSHRRRTSFGVFNKGERDEFRDQHRVPPTPKSGQSRPSVADRSYTNTDESDASGEDKEEKRTRPTRSVPAGETTTHVQSDLGSNMELIFEIVIVKVPLLQLHGLQFKKVNGGTWQYKGMAQAILAELRL